MFKIRHRVQRIVNRVVRLATASSCRATPENRITNARDHKAVYDDGITTRQYRCTRPPVIVRRPVRDKLIIQCPRSPCQVIVLCYHRTLSSKTNRKTKSPCPLRSRKACLEAHCTIITRTSITTCTVPFHNSFVPRDQMSTLRCSCSSCA